MAVCLHCLHEARLAARDRRYRIIMRTCAWVFGVAVVGIVGAAGANAALHPSPPPTSRHARRIQQTPAKPRPDSTIAVVAVAAPVVQQGAPTVDSAAHAGIAATPATPAAPPIADSTPAKPPVTPSLASLLPQGRTDLPDSVFAVRMGDTVVVHFDTSPLRTRRADKFELIVRQTLHAVYGTAADSALAAVPAGRLAAPNELLTTLPTRGVHLAGPSGAKLVLWPETRPGRDGPLVVAYRITIDR